MEMTDHDHTARCRSSGSHSRMQGLSLELQQLTAYPPPTHHPPSFLFREASVHGRSLYPGSSMETGLTLYLTVQDVCQEEGKPVTCSDQMLPSLLLFQVT